MGSMSWSEDRLHRWLLQRERPQLLASRGHDAAVLPPTRGREVCCMDATIEGVHFETGVSGARVGRKAAGRALSDLAATAAQPHALLLSIRAPRDCSERWLKAAIAAVDATARCVGAALIGGDLSCAAGPLQLTVTALGCLPGRRRAPARERARVGQRILLTGPVGGSILGRHLAIEARIAEGRWLHAGGATAMMDVSDGLAWDLFRMARTAGVQVELDLDAIPIHPHARRLARRTGRTALWHALHDGEDHELLATASPKRAAALLSSRRGHAPVLVEIGRVRAGRGLQLLQNGARSAWKEGGGWTHGKA